MSQAEILLPVFVQIALTFALVMWTGFARVAAARAGKVKMADIALGQPGWPEQVTKIGNSYENQTQIPVLFFVLVGFALITHRVDFIFVVMSWIFVGLRFAHVFEHVGRNHVQRRFVIFIAGVSVVLAMWIRFALQILWVY